MLYEEDKNSNTFNHLGFCVTSKHTQIGLTDVTSEIHTIYLELTDTDQFSQSWVYHTGTNEESGTCLILQGVTNEVWRELVFF